MLISPMNYVISDPVADIIRLSLALLETCTSKGIRRITVYASGVARGVHVGSYAPSQYTSAPLKIYILSGP